MDNLTEIKVKSLTDAIEKRIQNFDSILVTNELDFLFKMKILLKAITKNLYIPDDIFDEMLASLHEQDSKKIEQEQARLAKLEAKRSKKDEAFVRAIDIIKANDIQLASDILTGKIKTKKNFILLGEGIIDFHTWLKENNIQPNI